MSDDQTTNGIAPRPWRVAGGAIYAANDNIVGGGAIGDADNLWIVEAVNAYDGPAVWTGDRLFDALDRLFFAWDSSAADLGPEWTQMGEMIDAVRAALPEHKTDYERLIRVVARVTRNA